MIGGDGPMNENVGTRLSTEVKIGGKSKNNYNFIEMLNCITKAVDGTPDDVKASRPVWRRGKDGDNIKILPIPIVYNNTDANLT